MKSARKNPKQHRTKSDIFGIEFHCTACQRELRRNIIRSHISSGFNGNRITTKPRQRLHEIYFGLRLSAVSLGTQQNRNRTENHLLDLSPEHISDTGPCGSITAHRSTAETQG